MSLPSRRTGGPPQDFEAFYAAAAGQVYRALAVALGDAHLAREAADEAMARAFVHWRRVRDLDNPGGWAFRVGLNWATSWRRRIRRERPMPEDTAWLTVDPPEPSDPVHDAALEALAGLPVDQRAVVVCRILFDLSTAETAVVLRVPEGTVRSRLSRAVAALRTRVGARLNLEDQ